MTVAGAGIEPQGPKLQHAGAQPLTDIPFIRIEPSSRWALLNLGELWEYRELLCFLIWRDVKVRYKQTLLGAGWAVLQPFMTMVVFTFVFGMLAKIPSDGLPYPVFAYTALLPWTYFSQAIARSSASVVASAGMIKKVYFPRLIVPISAAVSPLVDLALAFIVLIGMMAWFGIVPTWGVLALPAFVLLALTTALAVGLFTSAINVRYRDVAAILGQSESLEDDYVKRVLPDKIRLAKEYIRKSSLLFDLSVICRTVLKIFDCRLSH